MALPVHDAGFTEIADRVWVARHTWFDVNVGVIGGERGLVVVDTHASEVEARRVVEQVRALGAGEVVAIVNTHWHFDHTFGNVVLSEAYDGPPVVAHDAAAEALAAGAEALQAEAARDVDEDPRFGDVAATRVLLPTETFSSARVLDLGDRQVELIHPGRGHTAGDAVLRVPDADVLFAGDLVEESAARDGVPGFGDDCFPMEWPATLDLVLGLLGEASTVVPGHGAPVGKEFVGEQRSAIGIVAETIRHLASQGVPVGEALAAGSQSGEGGWPYPAEQLVQAVRRGYEHLPRTSKTLPLI